MRIAAALAMSAGLLAAMGNGLAQTIAPGGNPQGAPAAAPPAATAPAPSPAPATAPGPASGPGSNAAPAAAPTAAPAPAPAAGPSVAPRGANAPGGNPAAAAPPAAAPAPSGRASSGNPQLASFSDGNWQGGAFAGADGKFSFCAASADYKNGVTVAFVLNSAFQWGIALSDDNWRLNNGASYPVTYAVDQRVSGSANASAISTSEVLIPLTPTVALFKTFMQGEKLKVSAAAGTYTFDLTNTIEMLPDLLKCAEAYVGKAPASANPFASN